MSSSDVGAYTPLSGVGAPPAPQPGPGPEPAHDLPAASVREVPAAAEPEEVRYRYVHRQAPPQYHIYEEVTGERVTTFPLPSEHQAEDTCRQLNRINSRPR